MSGKNTVGTLTVEVQLELQRMSAQIDSLNKTVRAKTAAMNNDWKKMADFAKAQIATILPAVSVASVVTFTKSLFDNAAQIKDNSEAARMGVEEFQALSWAAGKSGVSQEQLQRSLTSLTQKLEEAKNGSEKAVELFDKLGMKWSDLRQLAPELQMEALGRALQNANDPTAAFSAIVDILGARSAPKLIEVLKQLGDEGFDGVSKKAKEAGQVISEYTITKIDAASKKIEDSFRKIKNSTTVFLADILSGNWEQVGTQIAGMLPGVQASRSATTEEMDAFLEKQQDELFRKAAARAKDLRGITKIDGGGWFEKAIDSATIGKELNDIASESTSTGKTMEDAFSGLKDLWPKTEVIEFWESLEKLPTTVEDIGNEMEGLSKTVTTGAESMQIQMSQMWENVSDRASQAFASMIMDGKASFAELGDLILRSMIEIAARLAIINPLMNAIFGGMMGGGLLPAFFGSGSVSARALGGPVEAGSLYRVNETGKEYFRPNISGTILSAAATSSSSGAGGNVFHIDARGADVAAVQRLESMVRNLNQNFDSRVTGVVRNNQIRRR
jgi:DNA-binding phage protein